MPSSATRSRPIHPRRISGPARRPLPAGPAVRGRTSAFERIARIPDYRVVDRVLRSRGCILLIGIMLGGIVAMQVSLLRLNTGISRAWQTQETVSHQNQTLQMQIAELTSAERIRVKAADLGLVDPAAGDNRFLKSRGVNKDARRAAKRIQPPSEAAQLVMANLGFTPGPGATLASLLATETGTVAPPSTETGTVAPPSTETGTVVPPTTTVEPVATQEPLPTPVPTVDPATGLAPQG